jgi:hypothetical protein
MYQVQLFKNFNQPVERITLEELVEKIKQGSPEIIKYRERIAGSGKFAGVFKKQIPAFAASALFENGIKPENIVEYTQLLMLDLDKIGIEGVQETKNALSQDPHVLLCAVSPTKNGLKVLIKVDSTLVSHEKAYKQVLEYFEEKFKVRFDPACKNVNRLCFLTHDPEVYYNPNAEEFHVELVSAEKKAHGTQEADESRELIFQNALSFSLNKQKFEEGTRNNFIHLLAANCNRFGLLEEYTILRVNEEYQMPDSPEEITRTIKAVYKSKKDEFNKWRKTSMTTSGQRTGYFNSQTSKNDEENTIFEAPYFDDAVVNGMPSLIRDVALELGGKRERDVFVTAMLTFLSSVMHNVKGLYQYDFRYPGLYSFICSPSNSGKGIAKLVYKAFLPLHEKMKIEGLMMEPMSDRGLFLPVNGNSTKLQLLLKASNGTGLLYEPGSESLPYILKNDSAGLNQLLKYGFDHEMLTSARELNRRSVEVLKPRIACFLEGNSYNLESLIPSVFSGLFPCFLYYSFYSSNAWINQKPNAKAKSIQSKIEALSSRILKLAEYMNYIPMEFEMTDEQWDKFDRTFKKNVALIACFAGDGINRYLRRLGVSTFRIAMILSTLEAFESGEQVQVVRCSDQAFESAMSLMTTFLQHAVIVQVNVLKKEKLSNDNLREFFELLPQEEFTVVNAMDVATSLPTRIEKVTVYSYLNRLTEFGLLRKTPENKYQKVNFEEVISDIAMTEAA